MSASLELEQYLESKPNLDWDNTPSNGIFSSGCSPFHNHKYVVDVSPTEVSLTIEPRTPGSSTCACLIIFPFLFPFICSLMALNINAKKLIFHVNAETNRIDFLCRSKSAFSEDKPILLKGIISVHTRVVVHDQDERRNTNGENSSEMLEFIIRHQDGVHAIEVNNDHKSLPRFVSALQVLLAQVNSNHNQYHPHHQNYEKYRV